MENTMLEGLGFIKKEIPENKIRQVEVYIHLQMSGLKIEIYKDKTSMIKFESKKMSRRYRIDDINDRNEILNYMLAIQYDKGYKDGQAQIRDSIITSLGIDKLINNNISERMDNI